MSRSPKRYPARALPSRNRARTRHEQQARKRRKRARAHLQKVSRRGSAATEIRQKVPLRLEGPRWKAFAAVLAGSFVLAGLLGAQPLARAGLEWWHQRSPRIDRLAIHGHERLSASAVAVASGIERGAGLEGLQADRIVERLVALDWIGKAKVLILPNGTALIDVEERRPRAILIPPGNPMAGNLVDASGTSFAAATPEDLSNLALIRLRRARPEAPPIEPSVLARAIAVGETVQALSIDALQGSELEIPAPNLPSSHGEEPPGWILRTADGGLEILLGPDDGAGMAARLENLKRLFAADLLEEPARGQIDLRFGGQAVLRASLRPPRPGADLLIRPRTEAGNTRRQGVDTPGRPKRGSPGEPAPLGGNHG